MAGTIRRQQQPDDKNAPRTASPWLDHFQPSCSLGKMALVECGYLAAAAWRLAVCLYWMMRQRWDYQHGRESEFQEVPFGGKCWMLERRFCETKTKSQLAAATHRSDTLGAWYQMAVNASGAVEHSESIAGWFGSIRGRSWTYFVSGVSFSGLCLRASSSRRKPPQSLRADMLFDPGQRREQWSMTLAVALNKLIGSCPGGVATIIMIAGSAGVCPGPRGLGSRLLSSHQIQIALDSFNDRVHAAGQHLLGHA